MTSIQNANPVILSASQLPTRRSNDKRARTGPETKYSHLVFGRDGANETDEEFTCEPIDEQEIYGEPVPLFFSFFFWGGGGLGVVEAVL